MILLVRRRAVTQPPPPSLYGPPAYEQKDLKEGRALTEVAAVPCTQPHTGEVVGQFQLSGSSYPGEDAVAARATEQCELLLDGDTSHGDEGDDIFLMYPREQDRNKARAR
ncbi:hypothetical protein [Allorhizocola rhizosphaerae]|uniref:hypothetical protein n=1 Tax=Allorhizocola rhizosphaerae TaxID=1872709 RepID=UPI0013C2F507|nr:hypothetical protein [Allorhizocola rhizosphaerae]